MGWFRAPRGGGRSDLGREEGDCWPQSQTQQPSGVCLSSIIYTQEGKLPRSPGPPADKTHKDKRLGALECVCVLEGDHYSRNQGTQAASGALKLPWLPQRLHQAPGPPPQTLLVRVSPPFHLPPSCLPPLLSLLSLHFSLPLPLAVSPLCLSVTSSPPSLSLEPPHPPPFRALCLPPRSTTRCPTA